VSGCPGREEKEVWFLGFVWFRVFCGFFFCKIVLLFVCVEGYYL
jgi:hypothetical protein